MKKYEVMYHAMVASEIRDARKWYKNISENLEIKLVEEIKKGIKKVTESPLQYQVKYKNVRTVYLENFHYGIHYIFSDDCSLTILAFIHTSRDFKILEKRLQSQDKTS